MRQPRFLFYAVNGLGLGHVTRLLGIARALRRLLPSAEILFLTASEASHIIYREGFAAVKIPSRNAARVGGLRRDSFLRLAQSTVWNVVTAFDPHCLVVDTFAAGSLHELLPVLRWPLRKVFVFRAQRDERAADALLQSTLRCYDLILVPHAPGEENVPVPPEAETVWTGPMVLRDAEELLPREAARRALGLPQDGFIGLLTLGGGGDPDITTARSLLQRALSRVAPKVLWVEFGGLLQAPVEAEAPCEEKMHCDESDHEIVRLRDVHPLMIYLHAFDAAVSAAGYNTTHELQAARVPSLLWPFPRDVDDQAARAQRLAAAGRALCVSEGIGTESTLDESNAESTFEVRVTEVASAMNELLSPSVRERLRAAMATTTQNVNGTTRGAEAILRMLGIEPHSA